MTSQELAQLVSLGEGAFLEFKHRAPRPERIAREVIAFANNRGGRLLLGVSDDGGMIGLRDVAEEEFALTHALENYVTPAVDFSTERVTVQDNRDVIIVTIPESDVKPHFLVDDGDLSSYVRVEHMSVEADAEVVEYMRSRQDSRDVSFEFGDHEQMLMRYIESYGHVTVAQFAELADIPHENASRTLVELSRAGVLRLHPNEKETYFTLAFASEGSASGR